MLMSTLCKPGAKWVYLCSPKGLELLISVGYSSARAAKTCDVDGNFLEGFLGWDALWAV